MASEKLTARAARTTLEAMASVASVPIDLWNEHANAVLDLANSHDAHEATIAALRADALRQQVAREEADDYANDLLDRIDTLEAERDALKAEARQKPEGYPNLLRINREYAERCEATMKAAEAERDKLREVVEHHQWDVIVRALDRWTSGETADLVALGIVEVGIRIIDDVRRATLPLPPGPPPYIITNDQIEHMVERFLRWRLPEDFSPDAGISFKATFNEHTAHPMRHEPVGTNLFTYEQAEAMIRHIVVALPAPPEAVKEPCSLCGGTGLHDVWSREGDPFPIKKPCPRGCQPGDGR